VATAAVTSLSKHPRVHLGLSVTTSTGVSLVIWIARSGTGPPRCPTGGEVHIDDLPELVDRPVQVPPLPGDLEEPLASYDYPAEHWIHLRTTNPIVI
jgi:hypothetical protein